MPTDWHACSRVIIDPVAVCRGPNPRFGDLCEADRSALADCLHGRFAYRLTALFQATGEAVAATFAGVAATNARRAASAFKRYPGAVNLGASLGSLAAATVGIDTDAGTLLAAPS